MVMAGVRDNKKAAGSAKASGAEQEEEEGKQYTLLFDQ
jgi:hypothetical protein